MEVCAAGDDGGVIQHKKNREYGQIKFSCRACAETE